MKIVILVALGIGTMLLIAVILLRLRGVWTLAQRKVIGWLILLYGIYLATLTGSYTAIVAPGIGKIAIGAGTGAAVGFSTWLVVGTVGVATGGAGVAIGALAMAGIGALFGGVGGASGGFGIKTLTYPLVHWTFWVPIIIIGLYFAFGHRLKRTQNEQARLRGPYA